MSQLSANASAFVPQFGGQQAQQSSHHQHHVSGGGDGAGGAPQYRAPQQSNSHGPPQHQHRQQGYGGSHQQHHHNHHHHHQQQQQYSAGYPMPQQYYHGHQQMQHQAAYAPSMQQYPHQGAMPHHHQHQQANMQAQGGPMHQHAYPQMAMAPHQHAIPHQHMHHHQHVHHQQQQYQAYPQHQPTMDGRMSSGSPVTPHSAATSGSSKVTLRATRPMCVLIQGVRGSGKTTQAARLAEKEGFLHLSSGDMVREKLNPFEELRRILGEHFSGVRIAANGAVEVEKKTWAKPDVEELKYRGVILDRFIALGTQDLYYASHILNEFGLSVDSVIILNVDDWTAAKRELARDEDQSDVQKPKNAGRRRHEAHLISEIQSMEAISHVVRVVDGGKNADTVFSNVVAAIEDCRTTMSMVPTELLMECRFAGFPLLADYKLFGEVKRRIQAACQQRIPDQCPLCQVSGLLDNMTMKKYSRTLQHYWVTIKADGVRVLLIGFSTGLVLLVPSKYMTSFVIRMPEAQYLPTEDTKDSKASKRSMPLNVDCLGDVQYVLDAECVTVTDPSSPIHGTTRVLAFDYVYMRGNQASRVKFGDRYKAVESFVAEVFTKPIIVPPSSPLSPRRGSIPPLFVELKTFLPCHEVGRLLNGTFPFETDGLIFQSPDGIYRPGGHDVFICKWKPEDQCTVDFRLHGFETISTNEDSADGYGQIRRALLSVSSRKDDLIAKGHVCHVPVDEPDATEGCVAECVRTGVDGDGNVVWSFVRARKDKQTPNSEDVFKRYVEMVHVPAADLIKYFEQFRAS